MEEAREDRRSRLETLKQLEAWLQGPMLLLSLVWLAIVIAELSGVTSGLLGWLGTIIWVIFILEFLVRLLLAPAKLRFIRRNWLTVLALVVPALRLFRAFAILRAARALRGLRLVRIVGTANRSMNALKRSLSRRGFGYVAGLTLAVVALGAAGMLSFEGADEVPGGLRDYGHALWWTLMLVSSLGSDFWPATMEGRVLSALLAFYGLAVFGYLTAAFASFFVGRDAEDLAAPALTGEIERLRREVEQLRLSLAAVPRQGD